MRTIHIYQIIDETSEGIIHTFIAPNSIVAERSFAQFINNPKWNGSIVPDDFVLVELPEVEILDTFADYEVQKSKELRETCKSIANIVSFGSEVVCLKEDEEDEA